MTKPKRILSLFTAALLGLVLAACSTGPQAGIRGASDAATAPTEIEAIAQLLDQGETRSAQKRLSAALKYDPLNPSLLVLQQGLEGDARADLGPSNRTYMVAPGDTMAGLSERFLGNRLKSYQLARYNGLQNPSAIEPGQILQIPGQTAKAESARVAQPRPTAKPAQSVAAQTPKRPNAPAAKAIARNVDKAGAQRARTAGLAALNKGNVGQAVSLLQRAAALDPDNVAIQSDLARANRISATVRSQQ